MTEAKLIVGLGNPDQEYKDTRHNIGFMFLDYIAKKNDCDGFKFEKKFNAEITNCKINGSSIILAKPQSYVNKTGEVVKTLVSKFKVQSLNIIIIHDDLDVPFGNSKLSFDRNSGGHKGIDSIFRALKTKKFYRLRIGLATRGLKLARQQSDKKRDEFVRKFVLSKFTKKENEELKKVFKQGYDKLEISKYKLSL